MDLRDRFVADVVADISELIGYDHSKEIQQILYNAVEPYDLSKITKDVVVYDHTNEFLIKRFISAKLIEGCSKRTARFYNLTLNQFCKESGKSFLQLSTVDVQTHLAKKMMAGNKPTTLDNIRRTLSSFYRYLRDNEIRPDNPMIRIKEIKKPKELVLPLNADEMEMIRNACNVRERALIEVLYSTACRVSEIVPINRNDIDWHTRSVKVLGKGNKERLVFFSDNAVYYLKRYLESRNDDLEALFITAKHSVPHRLSENAIEVICRKLGRRCGIRLHPHKLRHTTATVALQRGMPIEMVKEMLGHECIDTTMIYAKTSSKDVKYAHEKFVW